MLTSNRASPVRRSNSLFSLSELSASAPRRTFACFMIQPRHLPGRSLASPLPSARCIVIPHALRASEISLETPNRNRLMGFIPSRLHPRQHLLRHAVSRVGQQKMDITHHFFAEGFSCFKKWANTPHCVVLRC